MIATAKEEPALSGKVCRTCGQLKNQSEYHSHKTSRDRLRTECKACVLAYHKARREGPKREALLAKKRQYGKEHPHIKMKSYLQKTYGMTLMDYQRMLDFQEGKCAICETSSSGNRQHKRLAVDHCHQTQHIRGLLCSKCNTSLGGFREQPKLLIRAFMYLMNPESMNGGQPITPVRYSTAVKQAGVEFAEEAVDVCDIRGGSCGA